MNTAQSLDLAAEDSSAVEPHHCFACGPANARGLKLTFVRTQDGAMVSEWIPDADLEGYPGIVHGGIVSTVLDEAMAKVAAAAGGQALTAELRVRFRQQVKSGLPLTVRGWIESRSRRMLKTEATLTGQNEEVLAHAWATFLTVM